MGELWDKLGDVFKKENVENLRSRFTIGNLKFLGWALFLASMIYLIFNKELLPVMMVGGILLGVYWLEHDNTIIVKGKKI